MKQKFKDEIFTFEKDNWDLSQMIANFNKLVSLKKEKQELIFFCIGSDKCIADCLGPLIGTMLGSEYITYGVLGSTINATNLNEQLKVIKEKHSNPFIVAIDSSVGCAEDIGILRIRKGSILPGEGVGKKHLKRVGDVSITVVTSQLNHFNMLPFNVPLGSIYFRAEKIVSMIKNSII